MANASLIGFHSISFSIMYLFFWDWVCVTLSRCCGLDWISLCLLSTLDPEFCAGSACVCAAVLDFVWLHKTTFMHSARL